MQINSAWSIKRLQYNEECAVLQTMGNDGCSRQILIVGLTLKRPWHSSRFVSPCFVLPFHLACQNKKRCRKVLAKFTHELKTLLCVNTRATDPVRQSASRSQTSRLTSTILLKSAERCLNRMKDDGDCHIFFLRACILSYVRVYIRKHAQRPRPRAFNEGAHWESGGGRVRTQMIDTPPDHTYCCSRPHIDIIDQLELSGRLPFKSRLSGHRLNPTWVDTSEHCFGKSDSFSKTLKNDSPIPLIAYTWYWEII